MFRLLLLAVPLLTAADSIASSFTVQSIAGTSYVGDGGLATAALLTQPEGVATDSAGNLYIADAGGNRIRKVATSGGIQTIAGTGAAGFAGDGGLATSAQLSHPYGIVLDSSGNVYVADLGNALVRKIAPDGTISTIAGGGATPPGPIGIQPLSVQLQGPRNLAIDASGNLYISDFYANQVYELSSDGTLSVLAGSGTAGFSGDKGLARYADLSAPAGLAADSSGNVFIADSGNGRIREVSGGVITTIFSISQPTGLALSAQSSLYVAAASYFGTLTQAVGQNIVAQDVATDSNGNLYFTTGPFVERVNPDGSQTIVAGSGASSSYGGDGGPPAQAHVNSPSGVALDDLGALYIADTGNHRIRKITSDGVMTTFAGSGVAGSDIGNGAALMAGLDFPAGVSVDSTRNVWIADTGNNRICRVTQGGVITVVATDLGAPTAVVADANGNVYIADTGNNRVLELPAGASSPLPLTTAQAPQGLALDPSGTLYIAEAARISKVTPSGVYATVFEGLNVPRGIAVLADGTVIAAESGAQRIVMLPPSGMLAVIAGTGVAGFSGDGGPALAAQFDNPWGVAVNSLGGIFVGDSANDRVRELTPVAPAAVIVGTGPIPITVVNGASLTSGPVAPTEIVTIFGSGFDPANTQVNFDSKPATVFYVSATQINALCPALTPGGKTDLTVAVDGVTVAESILSVVAAAPALFVEATPGGAAAINQDGTYNSANNPAPRNSVVSLYATGWSGGAVPVTATIGGYDAGVEYAGPAPGFPGLMQINIQVPGGFLPPGDQPIILMVSGVSTQSGVTLFIR